MYATPTHSNPSRFVQRRQPRAHVSPKSNMHTSVREVGGVTGQVEGDIGGLSIKQINAIKAMVSLSRTDSSAVTVPTLTLSAR